ncbi:MAG: T9SS type A sorting domain-containing protein, partial [Saprospiraceae bacterium]|nr:T9SS type A sorting domain-containing protein [Saprospiraceae bacterium]
VDGANCVGELDLPPVTMSDNCSPVVHVEASWMADATTFSVNGILGNNGGSATFSTISDFPVYTTTVTYTAKDSCGNTGTCELMLTMADSAAPTAGCFPLIIAQLSADGSYALGADTLDFNSDVACGQQLFYKVRRVESNPACLSSDQYDDTVVFCCADIGDTIDVILRVYDVPIPNGIVAEDYAVSQSSDCSLKVVVVDTLPARCVAPQDVTVACADFDPTLDSYGILTQSCTVDSLAVSVDYAPFDSGCTKQTILRTFTVLDQSGVGLPCEQHITVNYLQNYYIKFPDDVIITACSSSGVYGEPEFLSEGCGQMEATYTDEVFAVVPDACRKIERTWLVYNTCSYDSTQQPVTVPNPSPNATSNNPQNLPGSIVSPPGTPVPWAATVVKINPTDLAATDYSIFWDPNARAYKYTQIIKIIDSQKPLYDCPAGPVAFGDTSVNHPLLWNQTYWYDPALDSHDLCEGSAPLSITATDSCSGANLTINFLLFLDLDNNGTKETVINSLNPPPAGTVNFNNAANPNYSGGTPSVFDGRPVPPGEVYHFAMHQSASGITRMATVQWKTAAQLMTTPNAPYGQPGISPELPYGKHSIKWYVSDECGNEKTCEYEFEIKDTKAPEVQCVNDLTINFPGSQVLEVDVSTFLLSATDNCTPPTPFSFDQNLLAFSLRRSGNGTGFPTDTNDNPVESLFYVCPNDTGMQSGELWVRDIAGNTAFCQFDFTINDINNICGQGGPTVDVSGTIKTEVDAPVANATVDLAFGAATLFDLTDQDGLFSFPSQLPSGDDYTLTPLKDDDPLNGVSTFDLVIISKHILGLQALNSPYKIIAADANHSGAVTTFDVVEIRKLILGIYNKLPANTSWRFVDKDYVFPDTLNPFVPPFPETIARTNVITDQLEDDFIGIKIGDVNNSVQPDSLLVTDDRSAGTLFFHTNDRNVVRGEEFTVGFKASEKVSGYQFTLNTNGLEAIDVLPGKDLSPDNFGIFPDAVTASVEKDAGEFAITFRAAKSGRLSDMIAVSSRITRAEAYGNYPEAKLDVALLFDNLLVSKVGFELYQNQPNPFRDKTDITCHLPEETDATLSVFDETGRVLFTQSGHYDRGYHTFQIDRSALDTPGVLYYKLETATDSAVRKMVVIR